MIALEVRTERDVNLVDGGDLLRVLYRPKGTRRWSKFLIVPDEDQTYADLEALATEAAEAHLRAYSGASPALGVGGGEGEA